MLISPATAQGIAEGSVTLAVRRWDRPRVRPGGTQRTAAGVVRFDTVEPVDPASLTEDDAARAGVSSLAALQKLLDRRDGAHRKGPVPLPPRKLGASLGTGPGNDERRTVDRRLDRLDAARGTPWTRQVLALIAERPGVRAPDLAASLGRETQPFKIDVRKLTELGLTRSLAVGYEISPRGRAYLG